MENVSGKDFLIERYYAKYEFSTKYMLSSSDAESWTIDELLDLTGRKKEYTQELLELHLGYTESQGDTELRTKIANLYNGIEREDILTFTGAEEGIYSFIQAVLEPGDHIIVMFPAYQSLYQVALNHGLEVSRWHLDEEKGWLPSMEQLQNMVKTNTKAIIINSPHNPTGFHFDHTELKALINLCESNKIILFSDEVYRYSEYDINNRLPSVAEIYSRGISLGVLSKPMGLPGLRVGWIATQDKDMYQKIQHFKDFITICGSAPSEFMAKIALDHQSEIISRNMKIIQTNFAILEAFMIKYSAYFSWNVPHAGNIAFIRLDLDIDVETFCDQLREEQGVLLLPSTTYEFGTQHFRIGFGRRNFKEALEKLEIFTRENFIS